MGCTVNTRHLNACNGNALCNSFEAVVHVWLYVWRVECFWYDYVEMIKTAFVNNLSVVESKRSNRRVEHCWIAFHAFLRNETKQKLTATICKPWIPSVDGLFVCIPTMWHDVVRFVAILPLFNCKRYAHLTKLKQNGHNGIINKMKRRREKWANRTKHVEI